MTQISTARGASAGGRPGEVLRAFLVLGLTSFGGPVAHLGYFRTALVQRRGWIDEAGYADLVALCQFLPGPASSQVGFALGLLRGGGLLGGLAAWCGFTLPSAVLLLGFAYAAPALDAGIGAGVLHGLKLVAVAVVAQAVWGMARSLAPDRERAGLALAAVFLVVLGGNWGQLAAIALGGAAGIWLCRGAVAPPVGRLVFPVSRRLGVACLVAFAVLLLGLPLLAGGGMRLAAAFYRAGALVFGGGHVVLPLLREAVVTPGWVGADSFLAGYGAAQAVPGPLFTFAAYLGAVAGPAPHGAAGAVIALVAIFLPGLLLLVGTLPFWDALRLRPGAQAAMRGANAAVVGVLGAALYSPVWTGAVATRLDFALAAAGFVLLTTFRAPPVAVVALLALVGAVAA